MKIKIAGYTLLEILIVVLIISITTTLAALTVGRHQQRTLRAFTQELIEDITLAEEQAILQPATLALFFSDKDFGFYEYHQGIHHSSWAPLTDRELGKHPLPAGVQLQLKTDDPSSNRMTQNKPAVIIANNGNLSPFVLLISDKDKKQGFTIIGHPDGTVLVANGF